MLLAVNLKQQKWQMCRTRAWWRR